MFTLICWVVVPKTTDVLIRLMWLGWFLGFGLALTSARLHDVAQKKTDIVFDDDDNESGEAASSIHDDAKPLTESDTTVYSGAYGEYADETLSEKPADSDVTSQMQTAMQVQQKKTRVEEQWPTNGGMHLMPVPDSSTGTLHKVKSLVATSRVVSPNLGPLKTQAQINQMVTEEYDDAAVPGDQLGLPSSDDQVSASDGEPMTYEDKHRKKHGDVDKIVVPTRKVKHADPPEYHPPPPVSQAPQAPAIRVIPGGPYIPGSFVDQNTKKMSLKMERRNAQARMHDQCMSYTNWLKAAQGPVAPPMGPKIVQMMKATCDGAIKAGVASSQYTLMCNSLGSAVEPFLVSPATDWAGICTAVIKVFTESGVGEF